LLLQAERELGANLEQLSQYAIGVSSPDAARAYLPPLLAASQHLAGYPWRETNW
jgi:hypothetical protein